jgi:hypothetical protein
MVNRRHLVIAGSIIQYRIWLEKNNFDSMDYINIYEPRDVRGINPKEIEFHLVGSYWNNAFYKSLEIEHYSKSGSIFTKEGELHYDPDKDAKN